MSTSRTSSRNGHGGNGHAGRNGIPAILPLSDGRPCEPRGKRGRVYGSIGPLVEGRLMPVRFRWALMSVDGVKGWFNTQEQAEEVADEYRDREPELLVWTAPWPELLAEMFPYDPWAQLPVRDL